MGVYTETQRREIFHFRFLEELLRISDPRIYVIKGGVNLRFFFKSPRYSEDMDIDVLAGNVSTLKKNAYKVLESTPFRRSLQTYGIADLAINDPSKAKQTETTQRFRLRLILDSGEKLPTKVEFSRRSGEGLPFILEKMDSEIARPYNRLAYSCQHYSGETATIQKVKALAGRDVTQARDVFDLSILHSGGFLKAPAIREKVEKGVLRKAIQNLGSLTFTDFRGQVVEFLEGQTRENYDTEESWNAMKTTIAGVLNDED